MTPDDSPALAPRDSGEVSVEAQRRRYDEEADEHALHNQDPWTQAYRDRFIRRHLDSLDLEGRRVLDAMSASGVETGYLIARGADVVGLDISPNNAAHYQRLWKLPCATASIHETGLPDASFELVYICGGLHHVLPLLDETMAEVHRILRPGGAFAFVEPNKDTWVNHVRRFWYKRSSRFSDEEDAISYHSELKKHLALGFEEQSVHFGGNVAYLLIGQSLALGVPASLKGALARISFPLERLLDRLPFMPKLFFVAVWKKVDAAAS